MLPDHIPPPYFKILFRFTMFCSVNGILVLLWADLLNVSYITYSVGVELSWLVYIFCSWHTVLCCIFTFYLIFGYIFCKSFRKLRAEVIFEFYLCIYRIFLEFLDEKLYFSVYFRNYGNLLQLKCWQNLPNLWRKFFCHLKSCWCKILDI